MFHRIWPVTPNYVRRMLRTAELIATCVRVVWTDHRRGRIKFHVNLALKYALLPAAERKWRTIAAFSDRVLDCRTRQNRHHVSLSFILDCSGWAVT